MADFIPPLNQDVQDCVAVCLHSDIDQHETDHPEPEQTKIRLKRALPSLCREIRAAAGILWEETENSQLLWSAGHNVAVSWTQVNSRYTGDILLNAAEALNSEQPELYEPPVDEGVLSCPGIGSRPNRMHELEPESASDPLRWLVMNYYQVLVPIALPTAAYVFQLFALSQDSGVDLRSRAVRLHRQVQRNLR